MSADTLHVACIAEGAYLRHAGAMLHSVLARTPGPIDIHVLHESAIDDQEAARLRSVTDQRHATLRFHRVDAGAAADFPGGYFHRSIWFRVLLPQLLPELERVLYLDADLIATDDLRPLWQTALGDHLLAAVTNPMYPFMPPYPRTHLGIDDPADYLNSGVLLLNLAQMRREHTSRQLVDYARAHPNLHWPDQDALNVVCRGRWLHLHPRWNAQTTYIELRDADLPVPAATAQEARRHPALVHFIGPFKPWTYMCRHPLRHLYAEHARQTPWGAPALEGRSLRALLLRDLPLQRIDQWLAFERWLQARARGVLRRVRRLAGATP